MTDQLAQLADDHALLLERQATLHALGLVRARKLLLEAELIGGGGLFIALCLLNLLPGYIQLVLQQPCHLLVLPHGGGMLGGALLEPFDLLPQFYDLRGGGVLKNGRRNVEMAMG